MNAPWLEAMESMRDETYAALQKKIIPNLEDGAFLGVRTPDLRRLAKEMVKSGEGEAFLQLLPHPTFDENQLHTFILSEEKDFDRCVQKVCQFLPYVDNWATCDQMSPKVFRKNKHALLPYIDGWLQDRHPYTVRFAIGMLMQHFLDGDFSPAYLERAAAVQSDEYYVKMMVAWYFATALAKQYESALPYIRDRRLSPWTHNKAIQKALESYRVPEERKALLKTYKIPTKA